MLLSTIWFSRTVSLVVLRMIAGIVLVDLGVRIEMEPNYGKEKYSSEVELIGKTSSFIAIFRKPLSSFVLQFDRIDNSPISASNSVPDTLDLIFTPINSV